MSVHVIARVWDVDLDPAEKLVLLVLADFANKDGSSVWPSKGTIARMTGYDPRTVQRHLGSLRDRGLIRIVQGHSQHRPTEYAIAVENLVRRAQGGQDVPSDNEPDETTMSPRGGTGSPDPSSTDPPEDHRSNDVRTSAKAEPYAAGFDEVWAHYPRKEARKAAFRAYQARRRAGVPAEELLIATEAYAESVSDTERSFMKLGSTFYGPNEHWKDYLAENDSAPAAKPKPVCPDHGPGKCFHQQGQGWVHVTDDS